MEERVKELFSNEEYVKELFELGNYEAAADKLQEDGVEASADELRKAMQLLQKKQAGELSDEELEDIAGGWILAGVITFLVATAIGGGVVAGVALTDNWNPCTKVPPGITNNKPSGNC